MEYTRPQFDPKNMDHQLIVAGMANLVTTGKMTPHEVFDLLEDIKSQTWHALSEMHKEGR